MIDGYQCDLFFDLKAGILQVFIDGKEVSNARYKPTYLSFSPSNIQTLAIFHLDLFIKKSLETC